MRDRVVFWLKALMGFASALLCGFIVLRGLLIAFPPTEYPVVVWMHVGVLWLVYGVLWMVVVLIALPGGWAPPGCWRFVLFGFGLVLLDGYKLGAERMKFLRDAQYTLWPVGERWILSPALPGWVTRLWRRWRKS